MWLCDYVTMWLCDYVTMGLNDYVTMWLWDLCDYGIYVTMWLCDYVTMWLCTYSTLWLCDYGTMWLCDYGTMWLWTMCAFNSVPEILKIAIRIQLHNTHSWKITIQIIRYLSWVFFLFGLTIKNILQNKTKIRIVDCDTINMKNYNYFRLGENI